MSGNERPSPKGPHNGPESEERSSDAGTDPSAEAVGPAAGSMRISRYDRDASGARPTPPPEATTVELFEKAVASHSRRLLAIARAIVGTRAAPEDIVQQAVMNLFQHRHRYDWREPGGLLKRAVVNESLRLLRHPRMASVAEEHPDSADTPIGGMIDNETVQQVRSAIAKLPDHFRAALVLCEYENMSYADIAQTLNASVPQVKTWIHRARRQMEGMLKGYVEAKRKGNEEVRERQGS